MRKDIRLLMLTETLAYKPITILDILVRNGYDGNVVLMCDAGQGLVPFRWTREDSVKLAIFSLDYCEKLMPAASRRRVRRFRDEAKRLAQLYLDNPEKAGRIEADTMRTHMRAFADATCTQEFAYEDAAFRIIHIAVAEDHMCAAYTQLNCCYNILDGYNKGAAYAAQEYALGLVAEHARKEDICRS